MKTRPTSDHDRQRLKAATGRSIDRAGGGTSLAGQTRVEMPALSKYRSSQEDAAYMPIDVALDTDMSAGAPIILSAMASILGYTVTPLDGVAGDGKSLHELVGSLIREAGEVSAAFVNAMADGRLTPNERNSILREIDEATTALWKLRDKVRSE